MEKSARGWISELSFLQFIYIMIFFLSGISYHDILHLWLNCTYNKTTYRQLSSFKVLVWTV